MKHLLFPVAVVPIALAVLLLPACEGCGPPPSVAPGDPVTLDKPDAGEEGCSTDADCPFGEECVEGACRAVASVAQDDGCVKEEDCAAGFSCALTTGLCIPDASAPPPLPGPAGPCTDGEERTCGAKIGACEYGVERCVSDNWSGTCEGGRGPVAESCNGVDDDCDGLADNGFDLGDPCSAGLGVCAQDGFVVCSADGRDTTCSAVPLSSAERTESCGDDEDDDCDGVSLDELEFPNLGDACSVGTGACRRSGSFVCSGDGVGTVCDAAPGAPAAQDLCGNQIDDDCDGVVDEGFGALDATCELPGACPVPGHLRCSADLLDLDCVPDEAVGPESVCDGLDEDNDNCPDDGFALGLNCAAGVGACRRTGLTVCNATQNGTSCNAVAGAPATELCGNTIDEDCDGLLDEGFNLGAPCTVGVGACQRSGTLICGSGGTAAVCSVSAGAPSAERCGNTVDEDCDGRLDNGLDLGASCTAGDGVCLRSGTKICNASNTLTTICNAVAGSPNPLGELCGNSLDDDCDRGVDEGFANLNNPCNTGAGDCRREGTFVCSGDRTATVCNAAAGNPVPESCDNRDNDCNSIVDNGCDDDGDSYCDAALAFAGGNVTLCPLSTSSALLDCADTNAAIHPGAAETCRIDAIDMNCDGNPDDGCPACNPNVDNDFDGTNQCNDCDDTNGAVKPGATERCDGFDNDCDSEIDEGFDLDGDDFTTCGTLPGGGLDRAAVDCNDSSNTVFPGACELCATAAGTVACGATNDRGNAIDEDCDGFVDETCAPCSSADVDGDGLSQCGGDCKDNDTSVRPGRTEVCDGKDTDCNRNTVDNCGVGEKCNDITGADTFDEAADKCREDLICVTPVNGQGSATGDPTCTSFCNVSSLGLGLGDGCQSGEICSALLTPTTNLHGCSISTDLGTGASGQTCSANTDCRSGNCLRDGRFTGNVKYCSDLCGSDSYCGTGTTCHVTSIDTGRCLRQDSLEVRDTGTACSAAGDNFRCLHGERTCIDMNGIKRCSEPCCTNGDCPSGFTCSLNGLDSASPSGGFDTVPMCFPVTAGNSGRQAGAACTSNTQCESEFCDRNLGVCVDVCCNDDTCPIGLTCEDAIVTRAAGHQSFGRFCLSSSPANPLEKR